MKRYSLPPILALILLLFVVWMWPLAGAAQQAPELPSNQAPQQADEKSLTPAPLLSPDDFASQTILHDAQAPSGADLSYLKPGFIAPGLYAARDYYNLSPNSYPIVGAHRSFYWNELEPNEGDFAWWKIDEYIAEQAAGGKKTAFGISTYNGRFGGISVPTWFSSAYPYAIVTLLGHQIPRYWHATYLEKYGNFIRALGQHFDGNPNVSWIQIGTGLYGENQPSHDDYDACLQSAGLDSVAWVTASNAITAVYTQAFHNTPVLFQFAPRYLADWERVTCSDYAAAQGAGLMHDGLVADRDKAFGSNNQCNNGAGHWDPIVKYWQTAPISFETYQFYLPTATDVYWGILNGLAKHADYLNLDKCLLNQCDENEQVIQPFAPRTENFPVFRFANRYLGKTLQTTPSVWTVLRETEYTFCPDAGNFQFWLYLDTDVAGGLTVAEWNVGAYKEGRYTRRTDSANGSRYMYFNVDDGYIYNNSPSAVITVRYLDKGTDRWQLQYHATSETYKLAGEVQKLNTNSWLTATFTLNDAKFSNFQTGGNDFRIDALTDGNEWIHMVDVRKGTTSGSAQIDLLAGANLISLPVVPGDPSLTAALSSISGLYTKAFAFVNGEWKRYIVGAPPTFNTLTTLNEKVGFWLYMASPATLTVNGTSPSSTTIPLVAGANLVGYPSSSTRPITDALSSIAGKYTKVFVYVNGEWKRYIVGAPPLFNTLTQMEPERGYWIYTSEACDWVINN